MILNPRADGPACQNSYNDLGRVIALVRVREGPAQKWGFWAPQERSLVEQTHRELHQPGLKQKHRQDSIAKTGPILSQQRPVEDSQDPRAGAGGIARDLP